MKSNSLKGESDQGLHCWPFHLHLSDGPIVTSVVVDSYTSWRNVDDVAVKVADLCQQVSVDIEINSSQRKYMYITLW